MLTAKELNIADEYFKVLKIVRRRTARPMVAALVGLVGSGTSTVARRLAREIGGVLISGDAIRVLLRKNHLSYKNVRAIAENIARRVIASGANVVFDSDAVDSAKRQRLEILARQTRARVLYIRLVTDPDVAFGRMISGTPDQFFVGASTPWRAAPRERGVVVKLRELWRRTPHHYQWNSKQGGRWELKKLPVKFSATIDTTDTKTWQRQISQLAKRFRRA
ncbi:MAG: hypothetical protein UY75_C0024G0003 [Parcubacteria group bacterium GW2011_GWC2_52_8c]|nr:MAG: hypothetical protein UY64_C0011G0005 [Parcubacteria group bacterium GW2011_GWA1_51_12]KKW30751.1 MAG: hypothetical protein UY75_C0024G0003 [Parcubacteria group bacterium GW2011_GWC2_52_8c]